MSVEYTFNKKISYDDIETKTQLKIVEIRDNRWVVDPYENYMLINEKNYIDKDGNNVDGPTLELICYGGNNSNMIRDELIKHFNVKFIIDYEEYLFYYTSPSLDEINEMYDSVTRRYGYVLEGDKITIPIRNEEDYKPHRSNDSYTLESILLNPPDNILSNSNDSEPPELPF